MNTKCLLSTLLLPAILAAPILSTVTHFPALNVAQAASESRSALLGIALPRGAASYNKVNANFSDLLTNLAKERAVRQTPNGDNLEVIAWRGAAYREDRIAFTKSGLTRAMEEAGWEIKEIDRNDLGGLNIFESFNSNEEDLAFAPSLTKRDSYFRASNVQAGRALVGAWLESDDALAVGLLPVQFVARKAKAARPGISAGAYLVKDNDNAMKGLPAPKMPVFPKMTPRPKTVRGMAVDSSGKPLANVEVAVYSSMGGGIRTTHKAQTNAQGIYQVLVPRGIGEVAQADYKLKYNGVEYGLMLQPARGHFAQFNSSKGHIEHLILRTGGSSGGTLYVKDDIDGMIEVTATPVGKLMDGSTGRTFVFRFDSTGKHEQYLNGLPLGRYKLTARLFDDGETLPLRVGNSFGYNKDTTLRSSLQVDFETGYSYSQDNFNKGARDIAFFPVTLEP